MLTFEGNPIQGVARIIEKLTVSTFLSSYSLPRVSHINPNIILVMQSLPFQKVQHKVTTLDAQPSSPSVASLIVNVTGLLVVSRLQAPSGLGPFVLGRHSSHAVCLGR